MRRVVCLLIVLSASASALAEEVKKPKQKIAVLDLKSQTELDAGIVTILNELLLTEVQETGKFEVLGSSDIASMINLEEQRVQLTGCADDSCLVEIGGALGVNLLIVASVGAVGDSYLCTLKVLDVSNAKVLKRVAEMVPRKDNQLITAIRNSVRKAVEAIAGPIEGKTPEPVATKAETTEVKTGDAAATATTETATSTSEVKAEAGGGGFLAVAPWIGLGLTVVAGGIGGAMAGLAYRDNGALGDEVKGTSDHDKLVDSVESKSLGADVMFGVAGAAAAATVVLFIVNAMSGDEPAATAGVVPLRGGGMATVGLSF